VNALFICSRNRLRSPTAEAVFSGRPGLNVLSAGTAPDAEVAVSADLIEWADLIFVMEAAHRRRLNERFGSLLKDKRIVVLGIPDRCAFMDPELVRLLEQKVEPYLRSVAT
jgi:predicted protein tyrosine phosphatase